MNATDRLNAFLPIAGFELADQALVDLADAGFGNFRDYPYLPWDRPFSDVAAVDESLQMCRYGLRLQVFSFLANHQSQGAFALLFIRYPDDGYRPDRRV